MGYIIIVKSTRKRAKHHNIDKYTPYFERADEAREFIKWHMGDSQYVKEIKVD